jgi:arylsulfatase A-like enzyme
MYLLIGTIFLFSVYYASLFTLLNPASCLLYKNEEILEQPVRLQNLTIQNLNEAKKFIDRSSKDPFFLYFAMVKVHTALFTSPRFTNFTKKGAYIDNIYEMDYAVGRLMDHVKKAGKDEDTLFVFTSDNGPFVVRGIEAGSCGYVNGQGPLRGAKGDQYECGIRVPGIMRWKGKLQEGTTNPKTFSHMDFFPTFAKAAGVSIPQGLHLDGKDMIQTVKEGNKNNHEFLVHYCGTNLVAARYKQYKVHFETPIYDEGEFNACPSTLICSCSGIKRDPPVVYDLDVDPIESKPLDDENSKLIVTKVREEIEKHKKSLIEVPNQLNSFPMPHLFPCCDKNKNMSSVEKFLRIALNQCGC